MWIKNENVTETAKKPLLALLFLLLQGDLEESYECLVLRVADIT